MRLVHDSLPAPALFAELQQRIDAHDDEQRGDEEDHAGKSVQEALACFVAKVVGDQREDHDADDVGGEGDGDDEDSQGNVAEQGVVANDVEVEQAECFEGEQGLQAGAGVGDEQFVLADLQDDAAARNGVADRVEDIFGHIGDGHLHGHSQRINKSAGQRDHEEHEEEREPGCAEGGPAAQDEQQAGDDDDLRADFKEQDVLRAADGVEQQAEDEERPAGFCGGRGCAVDGRTLFPEEPGGDAEDDGAVGLGFGGPDGSGEINPGGDVEGDEAEENGEPFGDGRAGLRRE